MHTWLYLVLYCIWANCNISHSNFAHFTNYVSDFRVSQNITLPMFGTVWSTEGWRGLLPVWLHSTLRPLEGTSVWHPPSWGMWVWEYEMGIETISVQLWSVVSSIMAPLYFIDKFWHLNRMVVPTCKGSSQGSRNTLIGIIRKAGK